MSKVFKSVKKILKPIASVALPIAASFIPGVGPLGMALAGAAGGALSGGGLKGALLGGALSGLGAGIFGSAPSQGSSLFSQANNSVYNAMSPLRSIGSSITGDIKDFLSPLGLFTGGTTSTTPGFIVDDVLKQSFPNQIAADAARTAAGIAPMAATPSASAAASSGIFGTGIELNDLATGAALIQALNPQEPEGTLSQADIIARMDSDRAKQDANNAKFIAGLNSDPLQRNQSNRNIDYYTYGSRPEELFFDNVGGQQAQFKKGGKVKSVSPLSSIGGQDDMIDAKLSAGEYVIPADVVSGLGDGNTNAGAKKLDQLLINMRRHKAPAAKKGSLPPKAKSPLAYMGATA